MTDSVDVSFEPDTIETMPTEPSIEGSPSSFRAAKYRSEIEAASSAVVAKFGELGAKFLAEIIRSDPFLLAQYIEKRLP